MSPFSCNSSAARKLLAAMACCGLLACSSVHTETHNDDKPAQQEDDSSFAEPVSEASFETASASTDDATLSDMRGGFVTVGGLMINFGLISQTAVDHNIVANLNVNSNGLTGNLPQTLQQLIQTGGSNQAAVTPSAMPITVLTIVQNTANNTLIQNYNQLDLSVSNLGAAFAARQLSFGNRFPSVLALR